MVSHAFGLCGVLLRPSLWHTSRKMYHEEMDEWKRVGNSLEKRRTFRNEWVEEKGVRITVWEQTEPNNNNTHRVLGSEMHDLNSFFVIPFDWQGRGLTSTPEGNRCVKKTWMKERRQETGSWSYIIPSDNKTREREDEMKARETRWRWKTPLGSFFFLLRRSSIDWIEKRLTSQGTFYDYRDRK